MFVLGRLKIAAVALAGSWLLTIVATVVLVELAPPRLVVAALALSITIGQTAVAIPLVLVTRRIRARPPCREAAARWRLGWPPAQRAPWWAWPSVWRCRCTTSWKTQPWPCWRPPGAIVIFGVVAYFLDGGDLKFVLAWVRRVTRIRS